MRDSAPFFPFISRKIQITLSRAERQGRSINVQHMAIYNIENRLLRESLAKGVSCLASINGTAYTHRVATATRN